jgi:hypothetical protein
MTTRRRGLALVVALTASPACHPSSTQMFQPEAASVAESGAAASPLIGRWKGSSTIESTRGTLPLCIAPFWRPGFTDTISAQVQRIQLPVRSPGLDLSLRQQASEACHLQVAGSPDSISAEPWPYDEFDCALFPEVCPLRCHFQLPSSEWSCPGAAPEVWILGIRVSAAFTDASQTQMRGVIEIPYDHRPGAIGGWTTAKIVKRFELLRSFQ